MALSPVLRSFGFDALPGWQDDDHELALEAFRRSAIYAVTGRYRSGALGVDFERLKPAFAAARSGSVSAPKAFFEDHFVPCRVMPDDGIEGFVTGFYEPVVAASRVRTARFTVPLLARPGDLVEVDEHDRPAVLDPGLRFARRCGERLVEYHDRAAIECGALAGQGLELAWLADPVDAFFIHVQGAARLRLMDGSTMRVTYAAKSGHPFTGPGGVLAELGEIPREKVTMQAIRAWFRDNPGRVNEILHQNRSYVFFREAPVADAALGPIAAAKVPLTPGRSLAVDRLLHTFGTPIYVVAETLRAFGPEPFRRLMIAQDTGSAIIGPARGDLFAGSGGAAGEIAGVIRHPADFFVLAPHDLVTEMSQ